MFAVLTIVNITSRYLICIARALLGRSLAYLIKLANTRICGGPSTPTNKLNHKFYPWCIESSVSYGVISPTLCYQTE